MYGKYSIKLYLATVEFANSNILTIAGNELALQYIINVLIYANWMNI